MAEHRAPGGQRQLWIRKYLAPVLLLPIIIMVLPFAAVYGLWFLGYGLLLHIRAWSTIGADPWVIFVYSESPKWKAYCTARILPNLPQGAVVLNWSMRQDWNKGELAVKCFNHFAGAREFCPLALVIRPGRWIQRYRFFKAFKALNKGKDRELVALENEFWESVGKSTF